MNELSEGNFAELISRSMKSCTYVTEKDKREIYQIDSIAVYSMIILLLLSSFPSCWME